MFVEFKVYGFKMSSADGLDSLRERNKELLNRLRRENEKLERLSRKRETGAGGGGRSAETVALTGADRGPARAALAKPSGRSAGI